MRYDIELNGLNVLLTEPPLNPAKNRDKMVETMFEKFKVDGVHIACDALLSLYASGISTGIVWHSGYSSSYIAPIYEGKLIKEAVITNDFGGEQITQYLKKILIQRYDYLGGTTHR